MSNRPRRTVAWRREGQGLPNGPGGDGTFEARYLSGRELYGDDFSVEQIEEWFDSEREGYANLGSAASDGDGDGASYGYHALNEVHGFDHLPDGRFPRVLGIGSARGLEFEPIADRIDHLTILEPSRQLVGARVGDIVPNYVEPQPSGTMPFPGGAFDLVLCLGTLHHIPNVSHVVHEIGRVLAFGGYALIREPIVSMGDWRQYRGPGCTARERGIPLGILQRQMKEAGLTIERRRLCGFPPVQRGALKAGHQVFRSRWLTKVDGLASSAALPLYRYHAVTKLQKIRPTSVMLVVRK